MNFGFSEKEYLRVRDWLISALTIAPGPFTEADMLVNLRSREWHLLTIPNAACVLELCEFEDEKVANILVIGGKVGGSLRDIMKAHIVLCDVLRTQNFHKLCGEPRKEWYAFLKKNGFEQYGKEFIKRLN